MKIRMLKSAPGSIDGRRTALYEAGQEYDLSANAGARELATSFVAAHFARAIGDTLEAAAPREVSEISVDVPRAAPARKNARTTK
jgi:hypothetical protein